MQGAASAALLLAMASGACAAEITLFNTGVNAAGAPLAPGSVDPHWQLVAGPGVLAPASAFVVTDQHPFGHYFETTDSMWIWVEADGRVPAGNLYTFELEFDLTGLDPATAVINGFWGVDDSGGSITLNGAAPAGTGLALTPLSSDNFDEQHAFSVTGGFVAGINTLSITLKDVSNPGGLNVTGMSGSADALGTVDVPEPASLALLGAGLVALLRTRRRRTPLTT